MNRKELLIQAEVLTMIAELFYPEEEECIE